MKQPPILIYRYYDCQPRTDEALTASGRGMAFAAAMLPSGPGTHWMATGATADEAREKLETMWLRQFPEDSKRGAHMKKPKPVETVDDCDIVL